MAQTHDAYARLELPDTDATLGLSLVEELPKGTGIKVFFACDNLDLKLADLKSKGVHLKQIQLISLGCGEKRIYMISIETPSYPILQVRIERVRRGENYTDTCYVSSAFAKAE